MEAEESRDLSDEVLVISRLRRPRPGERGRDRVPIAWLATFGTAGAYARGYLNTQDALEAAGLSE